MLKKILLAFGLACVALLAGAGGGLGTPWLIGAAAAAGGFGWFLGGTPTGRSGPENYAGDGGSGDSGGSGGSS